MSDCSAIKKMNKLLNECIQYFMHDLEKYIQEDYTYLLSDDHCWTVRNFFEKALFQFDKFQHLFKDGKNHPVIDYLIDLRGVHDTRFMIKASTDTLTYSIITKKDFTRLFDTLKSYESVDNFNILSIGCGSGYQECCMKSSDSNISVILSDVIHSEYAYDTTNIQIMDKFNAIHKFSRVIDTLYVSWMSYDDSSYELLITFLYSIENIKFLIIVGDEELCTTSFFYILRSKYYTLIESVKLINFHGFNDNMKLFVKNDDLIDMNDFGNISFRSKQLTLEKIKFVLCLYKYNHITNVDKIRKAVSTVGYRSISRKTIRWILHQYFDKI